MTINPQQNYALTTLVKAGLFPNIKTYITAFKYVSADMMKGKNSLLKPTIIGEGHARRVFILGANFIKYINSLNKDVERSNSVGEGAKSKAVKSKRSN